LAQQGRVVEAKAAAKTARLWVNITAILCFIFFILGLIGSMFEDMES